MMGSSSTNNTNSTTRMSWKNYRTCFIHGQHEGETCPRYPEAEERVESSTRPDDGRPTTAARLRGIAILFFVFFAITTVILMLKLVDCQNENCMIVPSKYNDWSYETILVFLGLASSSMVLGCIFLGCNRLIEYRDERRRTRGFSGYQAI